MKKLIILVFILNTAGLSAQPFRPHSFSLSYYGEMVTHPGIKLGLNYVLKEWSKVKEKKNGRVRTISKAITLSPAIGFFYHRRYQTGLFAIPEIKLSRKNEKGAIFEFGIGLGYLRTIIPNTYEIDQSGMLRKVAAGHHYFASNYFLAFGKDLMPKQHIPITYFIKPQFMYALPNFPKGTGYFSLELGINYQLE